MYLGLNTMLITLHFSSVFFPIVIQGLDKCCFSFYNAKIPVKQIESYHTTHLECHRTGIIFITKAQREICADPTERWVQMAMNMVDLRNIRNYTTPPTRGNNSSPLQRVT
uniref:C-C motif chemokine n=1 Tax=Sinocyclocheilus rhinocerous TaxID=307959 RepID=A0A673FR96_9TELE